jgi:predicted alpha/beta superfamily hydrolase
MNKLFLIGVAFGAGLMAVSAASATTVRIHYDAPAKSMAVRADKGPVTWDKGAPASASGKAVWTYSWPDDLGDIRMKPALNDDKLSVGNTYRIAQGATLDIYPFFGAPFGKVQITSPLNSPQLNNSRMLRIYLPPSYGENAAKRYPVLYMHDAQNLFDAKTAAYGKEWSIDETANRLIATGGMDEIIVVGIDNNADRIPEYTPCCDPKYGGGKLDAYRAFIVDTVKPYIDRNYRTLTTREHTAIMGSSLGGLASVAIAQQHPDVFSMAAGLSSSFWWNKEAATNKPAPKVAVRFYIDAGTEKDDLPETRRMRDAMLAQGYKLNNDLMYVEAPGATHNEAAWAARVHTPLQWFFGWGSTKY